MAPGQGANGNSGTRPSNRPHEGTEAPGWRFGLPEAYDDLPAKDVETGTAKLRASILPLLRGRREMKAGITRRVTIR